MLSHLILDNKVHKTHIFEKRRIKDKSGHIFSRTYFELSGHTLGVRRYFPDWFLEDYDQNIPDGPKSSQWQCHPATIIFRPLLTSPYDRRHRPPFGNILIEGLT